MSNLETRSDDSASAEGSGDIEIQVETGCGDLSWLNRIVDGKLSPEAPARIEPDDCIDTCRGSCDQRELDGEA